MKKTLLIILLALFSHIAKSKDYISYYLIHVAVDHTLKEHERQKSIRNNQAVVTAEEEINRGKMSSFNRKYKQVKERLNSLSLLFDGAFMSMEAYPLLNSIVKTQQDIVREVQAAPYLIPLAISSEAQFVEKARSIIMFLTGLALTYGDINQMKAGDRKMLLHHAIDELYLLDGISTGLLNTINNIKLAQQLKKAQFETWVNRDKEIINDIITNAKVLL